MQFFSERLKKQRGKAGFSQSQLAAKCTDNVTSTDLSNWENGRGKPSYNKLFALKRALGCSFDDLDEGVK